MGAGAFLPAGPELGQKGGQRGSPYLGNRGLICRKGFQGRKDKKRKNTGTEALEQEGAQDAEGRTLGAGARLSAGSQGPTAHSQARTPLTSAPWNAESSTTRHPSPELPQGQL